ncbi:hypothetical protein CHUAL_006896 [Chamberlinius hualienensis]
MDNNGITGNLNPIHSNVICNGCNRPLTGFRYKCIQCPNYDLCSNCEMSELHSQHLVIRIPSPTLNIGLENRSVVCHQNYFCDYCRERIYGYRYSCLTCTDFDLCVSCEYKMRHHYHQTKRIAAPLLIKNEVLRTFCTWNPFAKASCDSSDEIAPSTCNILLLSETGVGKSTFINALANYLAYDTLQEAILMKPKVLITTQFHVFDEQYNKRLIYRKGTADDNPTVSLNGQSTTQKCKRYRMPLFHNTEINVIDTPGLGDTRGIFQDELNLKEIFSYLSNFEELHAICILLKPNESRLTASFQYCIRQMFCCLHKNAAENIKFVFTNSRITSFRGGETIELLRTILEDVRTLPPYTSLDLNIKTTFFVDNEAFNFALRCSEVEDYEYFKNYDRSWTKSAAACKDLIFNLNGGVNPIIPHKVKESLRIYNSRFAIKELCKPLSYITSSAKQCVELKRQEQKIAANQSMNRVVSYQQVLSVRIKNHRHTITVCTGINCRQQVRNGNVTQYHFSQPCHNPCTCIPGYVPKNEVGHPLLINCKVINKPTAICTACRCNYKCHMHIGYTTKINKVRVPIQEAAPNTINHKTIEKLQTKIEYLKEKEKYLLRCALEFGPLVKCNALMSINSVYSDYVNQLIANRKSLGDGLKRDILNNDLKELVNQHEMETEILATS